MQNLKIGIYDVGKGTIYSLVHLHEIPTIVLYISLKTRLVAVAPNQVCLGQYKLGLLTTTAICLILLYCIGMSKAFWLLCNEVSVIGLWKQISAHSFWSAWTIPISSGSPSFDIWTRWMCIWLLNFLYIEVEGIIIRGLKVKLPTSKYIQFLNKLQSGIVCFLDLVSVIKVFK